MSLKKLIIAGGVGFITGFLAGFLFLMRMGGTKEVIQTVRADTIRVVDTVYYGGLLKAYGCDTLIYSHNYAGKFMMSAGQQNTTNPFYRYGLGLGIKYSETGIQYFILGEYVLRDYFSIGGYASTGKEIGVYGKVRF